MSETEAYTSGQMENEIGLSDARQKTKRKSHANKKSAGNYDAAVHSDGPAPRSVVHTDHTRATPIKQQAYAGPTFHHSPAASALPIPKYFLAKSLPNASALPTGTSSPDRPATQQTNAEFQVPSGEPKRESTPLDFLFDAARKAQTTPGSGSPNQRYLSPAVGSPLAHSPARKEGETQFPFEYDSTDMVPGDNGSPFSTPYKERIEAVRSNKGTPEGKQLGEAERKAKAEAFKQFLKSPAQNSGNQMDNPFNARPMPQNEMNYQQQGARHHSNPGTPTRNGYPNNNYQYFPPMPYVQNGMSPGPRPPGSNLRNIYSPELGRVPAELSSVHTSEEPRISTARNNAPQQYAQPYPQVYEQYHREAQRNTAAQAPSPAHQSTPNAQQVEDMIRGVLKMDITSRG